MTTLNFSSNANETLSGKSYNITQTAGFTPTTVTLDFTKSSVTLADNLNGDPISGAHVNQILNVNKATLEGTNYLFWGNATFKGNELDNNGTINVENSSIATIDTGKFGGTGMFFLEYGGTANLNTKVGSGQTFDLGLGSTLNVDDPQHFRGHIDALPTQGVSRAPSR